MLSFETKVSPKIENLQLKMFQWSTDPGSKWETTHRYKKKNSLQNLQLPGKLN